jgi:hypothetical protein
VAALAGSFIWLTWQGRNEYQKSKLIVTGHSNLSGLYDIYAVLGQNGNNLTWGTPAPTGPIKLETFSLKDVQSISLLVDDKPVQMDTPPSKGSAILLEFMFSSTSTSVRVPLQKFPGS